MTEREQRAPEGVEPTLWRFILYPEAYDQKVYDQCVKDRLRSEGFLDERTMLSLDHPEGITPTVRHAHKPASYYERRIERACKILPKKKRYLARVISAIYYHGRNVNAILKSLKMTRRSYEKARNWLYVYFVIQGNWERI